MHGQHGSKGLTVAVAVLLLFGTALTDLAQAQGAGTASAAPSAVSSFAPRITPGAPTIPTPTPTVGAGAANSAPLSRIDHALWVSNPAASGSPAGQDTSGGASAQQATGNGPALSRIDHVLVIEAHSSPSPAYEAPSSIPQAASRPEAHQTPGNAGAGQAVSGSPSAPVAQPQPGAMRTPAGTSAVAANVPHPEATPKLSPIDHVLVVSAHPPGSPGSVDGVDHAFPLVDHEPLDANKVVYGPGHALLTSLHLPADHHLTEGQILLNQTPDDSCRNPMSWSVMVHKSKYDLDVFYKGRYFGSFNAVFGRNPDQSAKLYEGDLKTPEGVYLIIEKYYNPRWRWFLRLNYPNYRDRTRYRTMLDEGLVPVLWGHARALGGAIGIHGTDRPQFNRLHVNWTLGCISLDNDAIDELNLILPVGTMVIIEK